jgi:hypothetical protein
MSRVWQSLCDLMGLSVPAAKVNVKPAAPRPGGTAPYVRVERDRRALWDVRGWKRQGDRLEGAFRTPRGSFVGEVILHGRGQPEFYILNPPEGLLKGSHGSCFRSRRNGRYWVHFGRASYDVDAGIVAIEKLIARALEPRR